MTRKYLIIESCGACTNRIYVRDNDYNYCVLTDEVLCDLYWAGIPENCPLPDVEKGTSATISESS